MIDLSAAHRTEIELIMQLFLPGTEVRLVGSRALGPTKRYADVDLLVMCNEPLSPRLRALLNNAFEESSLPYKVDVLDWPSLAPDFRAGLLRSSVPLVRHPAEV